MPILYMRIFMCVYVCRCFYILHIKQSRYALALCWRMLLRSRHSQRHKSLNRLAFLPLPARSHISNTRRCCCCCCRCVESAKSISAQPSMFFVLLYAIAFGYALRSGQAIILPLEAGSHYYTAQPHSVCAKYAYIALCFFLLSFIFFFVLLLLYFVFVVSRCLGIFPHSVPLWHFGVTDKTCPSSCVLCAALFCFTFSFCFFFSPPHFRIDFSCFLNSTSVDVTATAHKVYLS